MAAPIRVGGGYIEVVPKLVGFDTLGAKITKDLTPTGKTIGTSVGKIIGTEMAAGAEKTFVKEMRATAGTFRTLGTTLGVDLGKAFVAGFTTTLAASTGRIAASMRNVSLAMGAGMAGASAEMHRTERAMQSTAQESLRLQRETVALQRAQVNQAIAADRARAASSQLSTALARERTMRVALSRAAQEGLNTTTRLRTAQVGLQRDMVQLVGTENRLAATENRLAAARLSGVNATNKGTAANERYTLSLHSMGSSLSQAGHALTYSFSGPLLLAAGYAVKTGVSFTDLKNRTIDTMSAFVGSRAAAAYYVDEIAQLSKHSPLAAEKLLDMARALSQTEYGAKNLMPLMTGLNNLFAAHHMTTSQATNAQLAFTQMLQKGKIQSEEVTRQLSNAGVNGWELFSAATGKSVQELQKASKAGQLLTTDVFPKLFKYLNTNPKYADASTRAISNLSGAWTRLKNVFKVGLASPENEASVKKLAAALNVLSDTVDRNMGSITDFVTKTVSLLSKIVDWVGKAAEKFNSLPDSVKSATGTFLVLGIAAGPLLKLAGAVTHVVSGVRVLLGWLSKMRGALMAVGLIAGESSPVGWIITGVLAIVAVFAVAYNSSSKFRSEVGQLWTALKGLFTAVTASLGPIWDNLTASFDSSGQSAKTFGDYLATAVSSITDAVNWVRTNWATFGAGLVLGFRVMVSVVKDQAVPTLRLLWNILKGAGGAIWTLGSAIVEGVGHLISWDRIAEKTSNSTSGLVVRGGALGKTLVYLMTAFQVSGRAMGAIISVVGVVGNAFVGLINIIASVGGLLIDVFTGNWGNLGNRIKSIGGTVTGALGQISTSMNQAGGAIKSLFPNDVKDLLANNAAQFNKVFDSIQKGMQTDKYVAKVTPKKAAPKTGGATAADTSAASAADALAKAKADKAAKAAAALKAKIDAARDSLTNSLKDFWGSITGSADSINSAVKSLESKVTSAFDAIGKHDMGQKLVTYLRGVNTQLQALANQRDAITKAIEDNKSYRSDVASKAADTAGLNNLTYSPTNAYGIKFGLQQRLAQIKQFTGMIKDLAKKGLNKTLLKEVIDAGPIDGSILAASLLQADKATLKSINDAQSQIDKVSKNLGTTAGDMIFGSISSLEKKGKSLQDQMDKIAKAAIAKVAKAFGMGWTTINSITGSGMTTVNSTMTNSLTKTSLSVGNTTSNIKSSWSSMIGSMNAATGTLVNVTYNKGVKGTIDAMAKIAGAKSPAPLLKYSDGGTVPGYAPRRDTVHAMLSPGEGVLVPELTRQIGAKRIAAWNKAARLGKNMFANGGIVNGSTWVNDHKNDPAYSGYDSALTGAIKAVIDPTLAALSKMAGSTGSLEAADTKSAYPFLHTWAQKLDKIANSGGNASAVLNLAKTQLGTNESPPGSNRVKYNNFNGEQWCADFVSWVVDKAGANKAYFNSPHGAPDSRWPAVRTWATMGRHVSVDQAQPGDLATYGDFSHINFVQKNLGGGKVYAIGGNQSNSVTEGVYNPVSVLRPNLPKGANGQSVSPWPGSLGQAFGGLGGVIGGGGTPSSNRALGHKIINSIGWGQYWSPLEKLWTRESNWNNLAMNPRSHAFGIAQALGHGKPGTGGRYGNMYPSKAANDGDPSAQINWGAKYIGGRYGNPAKAWAHSQGVGWYADGAWNLKRDQMAVVHAGEMIIPKTPATAIRRSLGSKGSPGKGDRYYQTTINAAPTVPTETTLRNTLSYFDTMYGGN